MVPFLHKEANGVEGFIVALIMYTILEKVDKVSWKSQINIFSMHATAFLQNLFIAALI